MGPPSKDLISDNFELYIKEDFNMILIKQRTQFYSGFPRCLFGASYMEFLANRATMHEARINYAAA